MKDLVLEYKKKKYIIKERLKDFSRFKESCDKELFSELCFCLLTPQSKATVCDNAIKELKNTGHLFKGNKQTIKSKLRGVRFPNNKTDYLLCARRLFKIKKIFDVKNKINSYDIPKTREWLVKHVKGMGYKEASHFLRNIGLGEDVAILDTHILKNLKKIGIIKNIPKSMTKKQYFDIENRMRRFSKKINIPLNELDLLFWSKETGFVFK